METALQTLQHESTLKPQFQGKKRGRKALLIKQPGLKDQIIANVRAGNYVEIACQAVGISKQTLYNYQERGELGIEPFKSFVDALKVAEAEAEIEGVADLRKGGKLFLSSATFLERRYRARWGRNDNLIVSAGPVQLAIIGPNAPALDVTAQEVGNEEDQALTKK